MQDRVKGLTGKLGGNQKREEAFLNDLLGGLLGGGGGSGGVNELTKKLIRSLLKALGLGKRDKEGLSKREEVIAGLPIKELLASLLGGFSKRDR